MMMMMRHYIVIYCVYFSDLIQTCRKVFVHFFQMKLRIEQVHKLFAGSL